MTMLLKFRGALRVSYCVLTSTLQHWLRIVTETPRLAGSEIFLNEGSVAFDNDKHMLKKERHCLCPTIPRGSGTIVLSSYAGTYTCDCHSSKNEYEHPWSLKTLFFRCHFCFTLIQHILQQNEKNERGESPGICYPVWCHQTWSSRL